VFETEEERKAASAHLTVSSSSATGTAASSVVPPPGDSSSDYMASGLTPPTTDIVKRRFELTRSFKNFLPYRIRQVTEEINTFGSTSVLVNVPPPSVPLRLVGSGSGSGTSGVSGGGGGGSSISLDRNSGINSNAHNGNNSSGSGSSASAAPLAAQEVMSEVVVEELVQFEEWMVDPVTLSRRNGITLVYHDSHLLNVEQLSYPLMQLLKHPELLGIFFYCFGCQFLFLL
jgi:hypothetical protein